MEDKIVDIDDDKYKLMRYKAQESFKIKPVRVKHLNEMMKDHTLSIRHSRPGLPYEPKFTTTAEVFNSADARYTILEFWSKVRRDAQEYPPPSISYDTDNASSGLLSPCEYPALISIGEAQLALPLIKGFLEDNKTPMAYALDIATEVPWCLRGQLSPGKYYGSRSFESFEESVRRDLIKDAFLVLLTNFDFGAYEGYEIPNVEDMEVQYFYLLVYFLNTQIYSVNSRELYVRSGHFPSDSFFTRLIDIVIYWMLVTYGYLKSFQCLPTNQQIFGEK